MAGYILKYSAGTYQRKISALEGYYSQLVTHLEQLNTLQGQMKDFWDGSASSAEYMNLISDKINEVKNRMEDCNIPIFSISRLWMIWQMQVLPWIISYPM